MSWVLLIVLAVLAIVAAVDVVGRLLLKGSTRFDFVGSEKSDSAMLFVYFPGILADGNRSSQDLWRTWKQHGDVLLVSYGGMRFKPDQIARDTAVAIEDFCEDSAIKNVVFIGSSMGGLLSYDTFRRRMTDARFKFILIDAPTGRKDLQSPLDRISLGSLVWWAGPISNLISKLYFNLTFVEPKEENIEPGVDRDLLARRVKASKSFPLSWAMDQNRYIIGHAPLLASPLRGSQVIYVRSTRDDDTVRPEAFYAWDAASGGTAEIIPVDSTHVGFNERPETWRKAFERFIIPALAHKE